MRFPLELIYFYPGKWPSMSSKFTDMRGRFSEEMKWEVEDRLEADLSKALSWSSLTIGLYVEIARKASYGQDV